VLDLGPAVFAVLRVAPNGTDCAVCVHNVGAELQVVSLHLAALAWPATATLDLIDGQRRSVENGGQAFSLSPYQAAWLVPAKE
jgi:hypothetical protein